MNASCTSLALGTIGRELHTAQDQLQWLVSAYTLSSVSIAIHKDVFDLKLYLQGCLLVLFGRLADLYGRKKVFILGSIWMTVFSLACAFANDSITLDILRGLQGIGSAATIPSAVRHHLYYLLHLVTSFWIADRSFGACISPFTCSLLSFCYIFSWCTCWRWPRLVVRWNSYTALWEKMAFQLLSARWIEFSLCRWSPLLLWSWSSFPRNRPESRLDRCFSSHSWTCSRHICAQRWWNCPE